MKTKRIEELRRFIVEIEIDADDLEGLREAARRGVSLKARGIEIEPHGNGAIVRVATVAETPVDAEQKAHGNISKAINPP